MTIHETVMAAIVAAGTAAGTRVYANAAPEEASEPYIVVSVLGENPENTLSSGAPLTRFRFQIAQYARLYSDAQGMKSAVRNALESAPIRGCLLEAQDVFEEDRALNGVMSQFSVWST